MKLPKDLEQAIVLYLYDELSPAEREELETHLRFNEESRRRLQELRQVHGLLDQRRQPEVSGVLLNAARSRLRERLRQQRREATGESWWQRFAAARHAPWLRLAVGAAACVLFGILIGRFALSADEKRPDFSDRIVHADGRGFVSDIDLIQYDPGSGMVTIHYKKVQDVALQGKIEDEEIRNMLSYAIRTEDHPGRRLTAVKAVAHATSSDVELEKALIEAMEHDEIDGVRLKAARVLKAMPMNDRIKRAFVRALLKDPNSAIRIEALDALSQISSDDVRPILQNAAEDDENDFVRLKASRTLERTQNPTLPDSNRDL